MITKTRPPHRAPASRHQTIFWTNGLILVTLD